MTTNKEPDANGKTVVNLAGQDWAKLALIVIATIGGSLFGAGLIAGGKLEKLEDVERTVDRTEESIKSLQQDQKEDTAELKGDIRRVDDKVERLQEQIADPNNH